MANRLPWMIINQRFRKIGQKINGTMLLDEGHRYYMLKIPKNESGRILIVSTSENSQNQFNQKDSKVSR